MPDDFCSRVNALLESNPDGLTHSLLVSAEESLIAVDTLRMTLADLQEVYAKLEELVTKLMHNKHFSSLPSLYALLSERVVSCPCLGPLNCKLVDTGPSKRIRPSGHYGMESRLSRADMGTGLPEEETKEKIWPTEF
jgi:hypothetical protein